MSNPSSYLVTLPLAQKDLRAAVASQPSVTAKLNRFVRHHAPDTYPVFNYVRCSPSDVDRFPTSGQRGPITARPAILKVSVDQDGDLCLVMDTTNRPTPAAGVIIGAPYETVTVRKPVDEDLPTGWTSAE